MIIKVESILTEAGMVVLGLYGKDGKQMVAVTVPATELHPKVKPGKQYTLKSK